MKVLTIVGARPQFIKAGPLSRALRQAGHEEFLVHTGQHYDRGMSDVFFEELEIPHPHVNLEIGSGTHGVQTGKMLAGLEQVMLEEKPDWVLVYGDTNSTLAGALAACKLHIPIAHVEAGLRSFNRTMPEEHNRVLTDHCSDLLFCPTQTAVDNLKKENIHNGVHYVGDVMTDTLAFANAKLDQRPEIEANLFARLGVQKGQYLVATVHRAENTDAPQRLESIMEAFDALREPLIFPIHPRTRKILQQSAHKPAAHVRFTEPLSYLEMLCLQRSARLLLTDSGGMQKEAYCLGVPCITLRDETEWVETVTQGWNQLVGANKQRIIEATQNFAPPAERPLLYGDGKTAQRCVALLQGA
jgi:UDP-GlcNAc3NAcA epimerase